MPCAGTEADVHDTPTFLNALAKLDWLLDDGENDVDLLFETVASLICHPREKELFAARYGWLGSWEVNFSTRFSFTYRVARLPQLGSAAPIRRYYLKNILRRRKK